MWSSVTGKGEEDAFAQNAQEEHYRERQIKHGLMVDQIVQICPATLAKHRYPVFRQMEVNVLFMSTGQKTAREGPPSAIGLNFHMTNATSGVP
jgi:hypothetical protein